MPKDEYSDLRRAYAAAGGLTLRTAQRHRKQNHPDWTRFIGMSASAAVKALEKTGVMDRAGVTALATVSQSRPEAAPEFVDDDEEGLSQPQIAEIRAWRVHDETFKQWKNLLSGGLQVNPVIATGIARELPKLREDYVKARMERIKWEIEERQLIPMHEFVAFCSEFVIPCAGLIDNLDVELPLIANPKDPTFARQAITEWKRSKAVPVIQRMIHGSEEFQGS